MSPNYVSVQMTLNNIKNPGETYTAWTGADGTATFTGLGPGEYQVVEMLPAHWIKTAETGGTITATSGFADAYRFANFLTGKVTVRKYEDVPGTGEYTRLLAEGVSPNYQSIKIILTNLKTGETFTEWTGTDGKAVFTDLGPGRYKVEEALPNGWIQTNETGGTIKAHSGFADAYRFANFLTGKIVVKKFEDVPGTGDYTRLLAEAVSPNYVSIKIVLTNLTTGAVSSEWTGTDGKAVFKDLGPGVYKVEEVLPSGWIETNETGGTITASSGFADAYRFANFLTGKIVVKKFEDVPGTGEYTRLLAEGVSPNYESIQITLINVTTGERFTQWTGTDGKAVFTNLGPGTYKVEESLPQGWIETNETGGAIKAYSGFSEAYRFANFLTGVIRVSKYEDVLGTGEYTRLLAEDVSPNYESVTITLTNVNTQQTFTKQTGADGIAVFRDLGPGVYAVTESLGTNWVKTNETGGTIAVTSGLRGAYKFANFLKAVIGGTKYEDVLGEGFGPGNVIWKPAYPPITVELYSGDTMVDRTTTGLDGSYQFHVGPGTYRVVEVVPTGWIETDQTGATIHATSGLVSLNNNFANFMLGQIHGSKYEDVYGEGTAKDYRILDAGNPNYVPVTVRMINTRTNEVRTTTTDGFGNFSFSNVGPGTYRVEESVPTGWIRTGETGGEIQAHSGFSTIYNFANFKLGVISGTKYRDVTGSGFGASNIPWGNLPPVTIQLVDANGKVVDTTVTDSRGWYFFTNVGPGTYSVREVVPENWVETAQTPGNVRATSGFAATFNIANYQGNERPPEVPYWVLMLPVRRVQPGAMPEMPTTLPAFALPQEMPALVPSALPFAYQESGVEELGAISGTVFNDRNLNGEIDPGEPGWANQKVVLDMIVREDVYVRVATVWTDRAGWYCFTNVKPGKYRVRVELSPQLLQTNYADGDFTYSVYMMRAYHFTRRDFGAIRETTAHIPATPVNAPEVSVEGSASPTGEITIAAETEAKGTSDKAMPDWELAAVAVAALAVGTEQQKQRPSERRRGDRSARGVP